MLERTLQLPCGARLSNRLAKAAMTERLSDEDLGPSPALLQLYRTWAESGAGLLFTGNVMVDRRHLESMGNVAMDDPAILPALQEWATISRSAGAQVWLQLSHPGRQSTPLRAITPVAPSALPAHRRGAVVPIALTEDEIWDIVERFAVGAQRAQQAGFSGVQVHAAHGYLLSSFLSPRANQRHDRWGGKLEHRARLLLEVVRHIRARTGAAFPLSVKLNSCDGQAGGFVESESLEVIAMLAAQGVDLLELSGGSYDDPAFLHGPQREYATVAGEAAAERAFFLPFAARARKVTTMPLMLTGGIRTRRLMETILQEVGIDVVGLARPFALLPRLGQGLLAGRLSHLPEVGPRPGPAGLAGTALGGFYDLQLRRLGQDLPPRADFGAWRSALSLLWHELRLALSPRNLPPRRPSSFRRA